LTYGFTGKRREIRNIVFYVLAILISPFAIIGLIVLIVTVLA